MSPEPAGILRSPYAAWDVIERAIMQHIEHKSPAWVCDHIFGQGQWICHMCLRVFNAPSLPGPSTTTMPMPLVILHYPEERKHISIHLCGECFMEVRLALGLTAKRRGPLLKIAS